MSENKTGIEQEVTSAVFAARWIMAPMYLGVVISLAFLTFVFCREVLTYIPELISMTQEGALVMALSLVEMTLGINLLLVILVVSYQSFIVNLRPSSEGFAKSNAIDLAGLKSKLIAALIAITGINLLKRFLEVGGGAVEYGGAELFWFIAVFMSFVIAWVMLAAISWLTTGKG
ncbi:YqhA family protein [Yoonia sp. BS5-3]|uniref:UPF0114 protein AABB29_02440 n=1 Tax=Yoonia phaeophyticola TaxID=3137369 RepID=A0ABZ2VA62_9RHOB